MTTNAKYNRYIEIGESIGVFINRLDDLLSEAFRPVFEWADRYWEARHRNDQHWPA